MMSVPCVSGLMCMGTGVMTAELHITSHRLRSRLAAHQPLVH